MNSKPLIFLILLLLVSSVSAADTAPPPIPCDFYGTVTIGGVPAPIGTIIQTKIYGTVRGEEVTTQIGRYEYLSAQVTSSEASCGCSIPVEFWVNGHKADQQSTFTSAVSKELNLTVSGVTPPTTSPTIVPSTSPTTIPTSVKTTVPTPVPTATPTPRPTSIPGLPHEFYGTVVISDGVPAPVGTEIE